MTAPTTKTGTEKALRITYNQQRAGARERHIKIETERLERIVSGSLNIDVAMARFREINGTDILPTHDDEAGMWVDLACDIRNSIDSEVRKDWNEAGDQLFPSFETWKRRNGVERYPPSRGVPLTGKSPSQ